MVILSPIPLNIINKLNIIQTNLGLQNYNIHLYKVDFTDKIIGFFEQNINGDKNGDKNKDKQNKIFIILWNNELHANPYQQMVNINFNHCKYGRSLETLQIQQLDTNNFVISTPTSINRYVYNLNTFLFKEYEILPGKIYHMSPNSKTEMVYYKDET